MIIMFNKKLCNDYEIENLYQLVLSGKWTFDVMYGMMKYISKDLNGDGIIDDEDQLGLLTQSQHTLQLFNGAGEYMCRLNADKIPEITLYNDRAAGVIEKVKMIMTDKTISINADDYGHKYEDVWDGFQIQMFSSNRALFFHAGMNRVTLLRNMETDFGIIPPPKYDENQDNYYPLLDPWCTSAVSIPTSVSNPETTGLITEALVYESRYTLLPAYYDVNIKTKFARDEESKEMIDMILANRLYDLGGVYGWGGISGFFGGLSNGTQNSLAAFWEKNSAKIESAMQKTLDQLSQID